MGLKDKVQMRCGSITRRTLNNTHPRRRSLFNLVTPEQVTENSLQVWRALPAEIRHDPSMASFQMENERLGGGHTDDEFTLADGLESSGYEDETSREENEFINMKDFQPQTKTRTTETRSVPDRSDANDIERSNTIDNCNVVTTANHANTERNLGEKTEEKRGFAKKVSLMIFWFFTASALIFTNEKKLLEKTLAVPAGEGKLYLLPQSPLGDFRLKLFGAFNDSVREMNETENLLIVQLQVVRYQDGEVEALNGSQEVQVEAVLPVWEIPIVAEEEFDVAPITSTNRTYQMPSDLLEKLSGFHGSPSKHRLRLNVFTNNITTDFTIKLIYDPLIVNVKTGSFLAALILAVFYALLVWEVFHRTFIAIICSMAAIAVLAVLGDRPTMEEIVVWMDMEMITLMFAMMLLVGILTETGIFDYIAVLAFELSGGNIWPLIYSLCIITCLVSTVLDNMTTVLLMTPVTIRLCEVMNLDPVPVLMGIIVHSNIGGALTPIGDPISIIICSNHFIIDSGVTFIQFVEHTVTGVILTVLQSCIYLRAIFWDTKSLRLNEPNDIIELRREIMVWQRTANNMSALSKDVQLVRDTLLKKVKVLKHKLKRKQAGLGSEDAYVHTLEDLKLKFPIKNKVLLLQSSIALIFIIICFLIQSVPSLHTLPLSWVALLGVIALLIVINRDDIDHMLQRIEWVTLLFFAAMFVLMECVERLGLISSIGSFTENIILKVNEKNRLAMAIFIILWISALTSAVLDSIPVTAMMVKVVVSLVAKESLGLPLQPLVWALVFGPTLGGNGTLYGASANVLSAGVAEQHGYKISFTRYLKIVFPMMLGQVSIITIYLIIAHIVFQWH